MVFDDKIEQVGGLFLNAGIDVCAIKGLNDGFQRASEAFIFFIPKQTARLFFRDELFTQFLHRTDSFRVLNFIRNVGTQLARAQLMIVVLVEQHKTSGVIAKDFQ